MNGNLIERIRSGDTKALDEVYEAVKNPFKAYARSAFSGVPSEQVADIYQDAVIAFWKNVIKGSFSDNAKIKPYIIAIGKYMMIKYLDGSSQEKEMIEAYFRLQPETDEYTYEADIEEAVKRIFAAMTDDCARLLEMFYFGKKSMEEIAQLMHYKNASVVKAKKYRCIQQYLNRK